MTNSKEVQIVMARTKEDCEICDKFLSKLITYESSFDSIINKNINVKGPTENNIKQDDVFVAYAKTDTPLGYIFGYTISSKSSTISGATYQYSVSSSSSSYLYYHYYIPASLKKVTITGGAIGSSAFYNCDGLTSVVIGDSVTTIGSSAFYNCDGLTSVVIPNGVTSIGFSVFANCDGLTSVVIPNGVTSIGAATFYDCDSLTSVVIPDGVTSIGNSAFYSCGSLTSVVIPDSMTSIGYEAFANCGSLTSVYYKGPESDWSKISIGSYNTYLTNATRYYYSETEPALNVDGTAYDGNYWRYDESGEIVVWVYVKPEE